MMNYRNEWEPKTFNKPLGSKTFGIHNKKHVNQTNNIASNNTYPAMQNKGKSSSWSWIITVILLVVFRFVIKECNKAMKKSYVPAYNSQSYTPSRLQNNNYINDFPISNSNNTNATSNNYIYNNKVSDDPEMELKEGLKDMKNDLPFDVEPGIKAVDMQLTEHHFMYVYSIDEDMYDLNILKKSKKDIMKDRTRELKKLYNNDWEIQAFINLLKKCNRNIRDQYKGNKTGKSFYVDINLNSF